MIRRSFLKFIGVGGVIGALAGCPRPLPGPDGGGTTPGGVISLVSSILGVTGVVLPILTPIVQRFIPDGTAKAAVLIAAAAVQRIGAEWTGVAQAYRDRGGDSCTLYALSGALVDALVALSRALVDAGFGWGTEIETLVTDLGLLLDRIIGRCAADAGVDVTDASLLLGGRVGSDSAATLSALRDSARARGVALRSLPPLQPSSLR